MGIADVHQTSTSRMFADALAAPLAALVAFNDRPGCQQELRMGDFDELPLPGGGALDPAANPFVARDGAVPPAFGGRDEILAAARVDLDHGGRA